MKIEIIKGTDNNPVAEFFSSSSTPETDAELHGINAVCKEDRKLDAMTSHAHQLERERDEARAVAHDLAVIASHCLGWHDHETGEAAERISSVLKRWKGEQ